MKTEILYDNTDSDIERAAELLKGGAIVAFPTETVYGLGANALDSAAVKKIFEAKGRPSDNPLIVHLSYPQEAEKYAFTNELFYRLTRFMPGPLTVILKKRENIPDVVTAGLDSVALRVPYYLPARKLIKLASVPVAAPSANISGKPSPTKAQHVIDDMTGKVEAILCGADCSVGVESTVVKIVGDNRLVICRPGGVTKEMLEDICSEVEIDPAVISKFEGAPISPGMKYKHYSPDADVILLIGTEEQIIKYISDKSDFGILCFDEDKHLLTRGNALSLGREKDFSLQAARLFDCLRSFDKDKSIKTIYARMPGDDGVGLAVRNRLLKAAGFDIVRL